MQTTANTTSLSTSHSYYTQKNGIKMVTHVLSLAKTLTEPIDLLGAKKLWRDVQSHGVSEFEKNTLEYILEVSKFSQDGKRFLKNALNGSYYSQQNGIKLKDSVKKLIETYAETNENKLVKKKQFTSYIWKHVVDGNQVTNTEKETLLHFYKLFDPAAQNEMMKKLKMDLHLVKYFEDHLNTKKKHLNTSDPVLLNAKTKQEKNTIAHYMRYLKHDADVQAVMEAVMNI